MEILQGLFGVSDHRHLLQNENDIPNGCQGLQLPTIKTYYAHAPSSILYYHIREVARSSDIFLMKIKGRVTTLKLYSRTFVYRLESEQYTHQACVSTNIATASTSKGWIIKKAAEMLDTV